MYNVTIFGINMTLNPIAFTLPIGSGWTVYWYGIIIATGFALAMIYGYLNAKRFNINVDRMLDVVLVATPLAILGARAYYLIFDGEKMTGGIKEFFGLDGAGFSGLAIYGGIIGAVIGGVVMCYIRKVKLTDLLDLAAIAFLIGQGIGRWGNFMNQEAFGGPTGSSFWGMTSENVVSVFRSLGYDSEALAHPCFLYESVWCLAGVAVLHILSKKRRFSGEVGLMYCIWYGFGRGFNELLRTDSLMIGSLKVSSLLSFTICIAALVLIVIIRKRQNRVIAETNYEDMFKDELAAAVDFDEEETDEESEDIDYDADYEDAAENTEEVLEDNTTEETENG